MNDQPAQIDNRSLAIAVLSVTACILLVGLLVVTSLPSTAHAIGQTDRSGDYIMLTMQLTNSQEGVIIVDAASRQMSMYALNGANKRLQLIHGNIDLNTLPKPRPAP